MGAYQAHAGHTCGHSKPTSQIAEPAQTWQVALRITRQTSVLYILSNGMNVGSRSSLLFLLFLSLLLQLQEALLC